MSSAVECLEVGAEGVVGLAGDVAFEAAKDLASVEALSGAFGCVGAGTVAVAEAADGDHVQRAVCLSVTAVVEAVASRASGACLDWGRTADLREGGFAVEAIKIVSTSSPCMTPAIGATLPPGNDPKRDAKGSALMPNNTA